MQLAGIMAEKLAIQKCGRCNAVQALSTGMLFRFLRPKTPCLGRLWGNVPCMRRVSAVKLVLFLKPDHALPGQQQPDRCAGVKDHNVSLCPTGLRHTQLCQITLTAVQICCLKVHAPAVQVGCPASGPT